VEMNKNPTYEQNMDGEKENKDKQKFTKIIIKSTMKQTLKWRLILDDKSRHAIDKIY
jgi:hypothetical protein